MGDLGILLMVIGVALFATGVTMALKNRKIKKAAMAAERQRLDISELNRDHKRPVDLAEVREARAHRHTPRAVDAAAHRDRDEPAPDGGTLALLALAIMAHSGGGPDNSSYGSCDSGSSGGDSGGSCDSGGGGGAD